MNPRVFREYDIRGVADVDFPDAFVADLGRAIATSILREAPDSAKRKRIAVGRDPRLTSPRLQRALTDGICSCGVDVIDIGPVPTPILYFAAHHFETDGAVIVTGSHNPPPDNGFKLMRGKGSIHGAGIQALRELIDNQDFELGVGADAECDTVTPYLDHALSQLRLGDRRCKVVVDAGNGAGGPAAVELYQSMGFDVVPLYCDPDGTFPNHHPDPTVEENLADLRAAVEREGAELGIAFDGDADRLGAVDSRGRIIWGDQLMILFGRQILKEHPGASFIGEVKCSQAMYDELERAGGQAIMWKVGHSLIKAKLAETGALLAGEMSGHLFFNHRYLGFDDGIYAGARLLELLSQSEQSLADLADSLPELHNTPELRVPCDDDTKFAVVRETTKRLRAREDVLRVIDIDGARAIFADGWGLVRASNTQASLVLRCEAESPARVSEIHELLEATIAAVKRDLGDAKPSDSRAST